MKIFFYSKLNYFIELKNFLKLYKYENIQKRYRLNDTFINYLQNTILQYINFMNTCKNPCFSAFLKFNYFVF